MQTPDGNQLNLDALYKICPSCFTEAKDVDGSLRRVVDWTKLRALLGDDAVEDAPEAYDFTWVGKRAAQREAAAPIKKTLRPCPEESVDWDHTQNLYIEGDNLEVLKLLQNSYMGKVKMIYIDPPYNTGNDFVYHDDFAVSADEYDEHNIDEEGNRFRKNTDSNGRFHSDWCSMMYSRLMVARSLLSDDGIIFISIDDNEYTQLKKICDEIFGADNLVESVIWKNKYGAGAKTVGFISAHEYILIYSRKPISNLTCEFEGEERDKYNKKDEKYNVRGPYRTQPLMTNSLGDRPNLMYSIFHNGVEIKPHKQWVWSKERMESAIANNDVEFSLQKDGSYTVRSKSYLYDEDGKIRRGKPVSILNGPFTQDGTKEMRDLFDGKSIFDFTKPSKLIEYLLKLEVNDLSSKNAIILDFFSGSATTAQAVMNLNLSDNGSRKFIMVQWPEETDECSEANKSGYYTICDIGKERIRRVSSKIKSENPSVDTGFRVFKCDESNMKDVYFAPKDLTQDLLSGLEDNIKDDRTDLDLLFDCMLRWGVELSLPLSSQRVDGCTIHNVNEGDLVACFDGTISDKVIDAIADLHPLRVVFRDSSFTEASQKMNLFELFKQKCNWSDTEVKNNVRVI